MEDTFITFETAKLAKEKGFTIITQTGFHGEFGDLKNDEYPFLGTYRFINGTTCNNKKKYQIEAPPQSLLQKWLREKHNIHMFVQPLHNGLTEPLTYDYTVIDTEFVPTNSKQVYSTYELALEAALIYALTLI